MAYVKIKSIGKQHILSKRDYEYIRSHLGILLPVMSINFTPDGQIWGMAVYTDDANDCISLFVDTNEIKYEVIIDGYSNY